MSSGVRGICLWRIRVHRSMPHLRQCLCGSSAWFVPGSFVGVPIEIKATNAGSALACPLSHSRPACMLCSPLSLWRTSVHCAAVRRCLGCR